MILRVSTALVAKKVHSLSPLFFLSFPFCFVGIVRLFLSNKMIWFVVGTKEDWRKSEMEYRRLLKMKYLFHQLNMIFDEMSAEGLYWRDLRRSDTTFRP
jgi:hypothetical protein